MSSNNNNSWTRILFGKGKRKKIKKKKKKKKFFYSFYDSIQSFNPVKQSCTIVFLCQIESNYVNCLASKEKLMGL